MTTKYTPFKGKFTVQEEMMYGWEACWSQLDDQDRMYPDTYDTEEEAQEALVQFIDDIDEAIKIGNMSEDSAYEPDQLRVAMVDMDDDGNVIVYAVNNPDDVYQTFNVINNY